MAEKNQEVVTELKSDLKELETILSSVVRSNVRQIIVQSISTLKSKIESLEAERVKSTPAPKATSTKSTDDTGKPVYNVKITSYGWDESSKFVKIYVSLKNIEQVKDDQLSFEITETSMKLTVQNHMQRHHTLHFQNLAYNVKPSDCTCKIKAGNIVIALRKVEEKTWGSLTEAQRKDKEVKDSKFKSDDSGMEGDPSAGIMNLMKKMYDDGDDDMKRMIKKTWYETQQKQGGAGGGMPPMPGM